MNKIREFPPYYSFLAQVLPEIVNDKYEDAITLFMEGIKQLIIHPGPTNEKDFDYAFATVEELVKSKLGDKSRLHGRKVALACSFCGKSETDDIRLIAGAEANICNNCVHICNQILKPEKA